MRFTFCQSSHAAGLASAAQGNSEHHEHSSVGTFTCALLFDDEVGIAVPAEPHDRPVRAVATPTGVTLLA